ncbi:hypothetical protein CRUP_001434 [Coryphaenoides rupestris]|nr:hypothetical protein CRUP_001434 [Coryphaenoides rupestris]
MEIAILVLVTLTAATLTAATPLRQTNRLAVKSRARRAPQGGCHLGTCQMHNLANTLYQISKTTGKDKSKNTHDPQGYGR